MQQKTLLFTTSYSKDIDGLLKRPIKWMKFHCNVGLNFDKLLIVDDGSPEIPNSDDFSILNLDCENEINSKICFVSHKPHLGRNETNTLDYPGWYRSFSYAGKYAKRFGYNKIIHIESDAYLMSKKIINHFNELNYGWHSMWCGRHNFPETAIQIICEDNLDKFFRIISLPYNLFKGHAIETLLPFSNVEKSFMGDRYGEYLDIPPEGCDYACQWRNDWAAPILEG